VEELDFSFSRSGGPGGQNVNKVSTRVDLRFDVQRSSAFSDDQKSQLLHVLRSRLTKDGILHIQSQASRSQWKNREEAVRKLTVLLSKALSKRKRRLPTKRTRSSREKRFRAKKQAAAIKRRRGRVRPDE
jgi:ribosome-associated protein